MVNNIKYSATLKAILNYFAVFIVFSGSLVYDSSFSFELRGSYIIMGLILFFWLPVAKSITFNRVFFFPFLVILISSLYNVSRGFDTLQLLAKQAVGISINAAWFYMLIKMNNYDIKGLFRIYLNLAFMVAIIGLIQGASYFFGFPPGYDYRDFLPSWGIHPTRNFLRINSILTEPATFCVTMMPAMFVSLVAFFKKDSRMISKFRAGIILFSFIISFSSVGYTGIIIAIFLITFRFNNLKRNVLTLFLVFIVFIFFYKFSGDFKLRIDDSLKVVSAQKNFKDANFSTFALVSNAKVACYGFKISPLFGFGLGSHELNYRKFIPIILGSNDTSKFVNVQDGASLFVRLITETGLLGLILVLLFIFRFHLGIGKKKIDCFWIINNSVLLLILIRLLRVGHYFTDGFFLFFWMYYFSNLQAKEANRKAVLSQPEFRSIDA